eukprot:TRINITY_DN48104_c0_g1_i1.p2 TRINITY_DN48104_c0_g1~~TRINITY_DN48104_c0_g1_i1.p2  ORF type:complete len:134 (+),score=8.67 TRINITY_DN48104_c0_g1_i1:205-606(+)
MQVTPNNIAPAAVLPQLQVPTEGSLLLTPATTMLYYTVELNGSPHFTSIILHRNGKRQKPKQTTPQPVAEPAAMNQGMVQNNGFRQSSPHSPSATQHPAPCELFQSVQLIQQVRSNSCFSQLFTHRLASNQGL